MAISLNLFIYPRAFLFHVIDVWIIWTALQEAKRHTFDPLWAKASASWVVTVLLPTPPLPDRTKTSRLIWSTIGSIGGIGSSAENTSTPVTVNECNEWAVNALNVKQRLNQCCCECEWRSLNTTQFESIPVNWVSIYWCFQSIQSFN